MASSVNLSERLQILENLLETFTREFQQLKRELDAVPKTSTQSTTVKEPERRPSPKRELAVDKEATMISEDFFSQESQQMGHQQQPGRGLAVDKEATMISDNLFAEESLIYEELNASGEWEDLHKELDPGKATIAFDFPVGDQPAPKPVEPSKSPSNKHMPDPWA
ncbi:hypothetical protein NIES593_04565 [Hydrococcus rivularis NIES-593]|uniref:Uncharacterized protein n=1 Tax=Hydrococcus rivularis NIES-593 TaxID=1921803 RepID=A0A1U7HPT2_9CYAN|nr:hypothetical protein [Hydrococcus rivularis]OKH25610.1 hypothetical protein NIES593_04565 [Hydrococcus rivularis NIES-593]